MTRSEYTLHTASLVMAQLCSKSASGSDIRHELEYWDELPDLAWMAMNAAHSLTAYAVKVGEKFDDVA